jgi:selenocysteine-specific elongation factor
MDRGRTMRVVATAGHVDHGKSTLVRALTGTDPDRFEEEKRRGLTIDLGFAWTTLPRSGPVELVDVPGHVRFISNMLAGVAVVEAGLLCVDAREGWRAQSEEHLRILDVIGLPAGVVALTKCGLVDDDELAAVRRQVEGRLAGTVLDGAPVVACDAVDGVGLDELRATLDDVLATRSGDGDDEGRPRLWVDRSFTIGGAGTVVTGGVGHGAFTPGDRVAVVGAGGVAPARVRGIQALGEPVDRAPAATRAALNLAGVDRHGVGRGDAVVHPDAWTLTPVVDATLHVLSGLDHEVSARGAYLAYVGTGEHAVRLRLLDGSRLAPGESGPVRLHLPHPLPLAPGDRFVLRESGRQELVGGGEVVDSAPSRAGNRRVTTATAAAVAAGTDLVAGDVPAEYDWFRADELARRLGVRVEATVGPWVVSAATRDGARTALLKRVQQSRPVGLDVGGLGERDQAVLDLLTTDGTVEVVAGYAVAPAWRDELAGHPVVRALQRQMFSPPPLGAGGGVDPALLRALLRRGLVVTRDGLYFAGGVRDAAVRALARVARDHPEGFTVSQARQALGTTRKWAVPLMELLDEARLTVRHGDRRTLRDGPS